MHFPTSADLTETEKRKKVEFSDFDRPSKYAPFYSRSFGDIVDFAALLPPLDHRGRQPANFPLNYTNRLDWLNGYGDWGVPEAVEQEDLSGGAGMLGMLGMVERLISQDSYQSDEKDHPKLQLQKLFAAPIVREMEQFRKSNVYASMASKTILLKVELSTYHTSLKKDNKDNARINDASAVKVWRLLTVFADTKLDSFHDQILAPALGWRRHYHSFQLIAPSCGAMFGQHHCTAIDMMHGRHDHTLDASQYNLRDVLRKKGDRLGYVYDLGDCWKHIITVLDIVDKGTVLSDVSDPDVSGFESITVTGNHLIAGAINCPPEDTHGNYQKIIKHGPSYCPSETGVNWKEHGIRRAFDFDLQAHQKRFDAAVKGRKNPSDGNLMFCHRVSDAGTPSNDHIVSDAGAPSNDDRSSNNHNNDQTTTAEDWARRGFLINGARRMSGRKVKQGHTGDSAAVEIVGKQKPHKARCASCGKQRGSNAGLKLFDCSRCHSAAYCGKQCQRDHWKQHRENCNKPPSIS